MFKDSKCFGKISFGRYVRSQHIDAAVAVDLDGENLFNWIAKDLESRTIKMISDDLS